VPYQKYTDFLSKSQPTFNLLPAVALGGPPHSGKSVLAYSLTQTLRERGCLHCLLRAYPPDGEGDWFLTGEQQQVRHFRIKGADSEAWLPLLKRDLARRQLPLLVDLGGLPTLEQETLLDSCTHAIVLAPDDDTQKAWRACMQRHGLILLADLHSELQGKPRLDAEVPLLRGTLTGLERGTRASGAAYEALVTRLERLFGYAAPGLKSHHLRSAPTELVVDLALLAARLGRSAQRWQPGDLQSVLDYLPKGEPVALYGRGPNWLYAAVAKWACPAPFFLFDIRLGWVEAPALDTGEPSPDAPLRVSAQADASATKLLFNVPDAYLDILEAAALRMPPCSAEQGIILSGKLPQWLWAALVRACDRKVPWIAVVQPQVHGAVVVHSRVPEVAVGQVISKGLRIGD